MSFLNNGYTGEQGASNMTMQSTSRDSTTQSSKRGKSGAGTYSGVTKNSRSNRNPPALQSIASTQAVHQPDLWETINSIVTQKEVKAGRQGDNRRPRANIRWEGLNMFGWVDGAWKPAAYHVAFREKLILRDAEQVGAPVWEKGMSLDYTSYSPLMLGWSADPNSIQDSEGRLVCRMKRPPKDWSHNPRGAYLEYDGLVMLDQNNRPVKNFPGAPRTLKGNAPPWEIEGLRRSLGMTYWDIRARMPPVRNTDKGRMRLQTYSHFSNCVGRWMNDINDKAERQIMAPWHHREKSKTPEETGDDDLSQQAEEDQAQEEELVLATPSIPFDNSAREPVNYPYQSSSRMPVSMAPEQTSWEGNHLNIPTFPGANQFAQTTNTVPSDSIYTASYSPAFPPSKIYSAAGYPHGFASGDTNPFLHNQGPEATIPAQATDTAPPESINSPGYPSTSVHRNIYDAAGYPFDFAPGDTHPSQNNPNLGTYLRVQTTNTVPSDSMYLAAYPSNFSRQNVYNNAGYPSDSSSSYVPMPYGNHCNQKFTPTPEFSSLLTLNDSVAVTSLSSYGERDLTNQQHVDEVSHNGLRQNQPLPMTSSNQPVTNLLESQLPWPCTLDAALSTPAWPEGYADVRCPGPEEDPFMGADDLLPEFGSDDF